jgi:2'-phosphotransferase
MVFCCGIIVFYENETVIVRTPKGNCSFPKGKIEKGETNMMCAIRELKEETNIDICDIEFYMENDEYFELLEYKNNRATIKYYVAKLLRKVPLTIMDPDELASVEYIKIDNVQSISNNKLYEKRKLILADAQRIHQYIPSLNSNDERYVSKALSWLLRHGIIKENMTMDEEGYVKLSDVLGKKAFESYNENHIRYVVNNNDKQRYKIKMIGTVPYIRANQGHCDEVGLLLNDDLMMPLITVPCEMCIHGTTKKAIKMIKVSGLIPMSRKHIHFADGPDAISGLRQSSKVIIHIDMSLAMANGKRFHLSDNGVILCKDTIEPAYFKKIEYV